MTPRQFCCRCLRLVTEYTTERIDRRTKWQVRAGAAPAIGVFHTCTACATAEVAS